MEQAAAPSGRRSKLVRDRIPEILKLRGIEPATHVADDEEYDRRLRDKLEEELEEFRASGDPEELADILEVVIALAERRGLSAGHLEELRAEKAAARGGFSKRIVMAAPEAGDIRRAVPADAAEVRALLNAAYAELLAAGLNFTAAIQDEAFTREQIRKYEVYVLEQESEVIATIMLRDKRPAGDVRHIYINKLAVAPAHRKRGLGSHLLSFAEGIARQRGLSVLRLDTAIPATHLVAMYSKAGYRVKSTRQWRGKTYLSVVMGKLLETEDGPDG